MELMQVNRQWSSRPADERFTSLTALDAHCNALRARSRGKVISSRQITAVADGHTGMLLRGPDGNTAAPSNFAFGQLATLSGAPAGYMRALPAPLAADCLNYGLHHARDVEDVGILITGGHTVIGAPRPALTVRAVTGPNYGRIWNSQISRALVNRFGDGLTGDFRIPGEFGKAVPVTTQNTTLYAGDRDMFVFLADEQHRIEVPNRRNGQAGTLSRGFFVWNSEVGAGTLGVATFLFDYACSNRIVWGAQEYAEVKIRHTAGAPDRFLEEVGPALNRMANASTHSVTKAIADAKAARVNDLDDFLRSRQFTASQIVGIKAAHMDDESRPMENLWDVTTGVTAYARGITYQNDRVALERKGGDILKLAA